MGSNFYTCEDEQCDKLDQRHGSSGPSGSVDGRLKVGYCWVLEWPLGDSTEKLQGESCGSLEDKLR